MPAAGEDIYRCFVIPTDLPGDVSLSGVEYRPGNRRVVHHILAYVDTTGEGRRGDAADALAGYPCFAGPGANVQGGLGGWVPGIEPNLLPDGVGRALPRKADIIVQVRYHLSGKPEKDRTRLGLYFARKPVKRTLHRGAAHNPGLVHSPDPPDAAHIEVKASWKIPVDVIAFAAAPHMHLLGRDIRHLLGRDMLMRLRYPDGRVQDLLKVDDWDFNWQFGYRDVLKVTEYFQFDPTEDYLKPSLQGQRLVAGEHVDIKPVEGRLPSAILGLHLERRGVELRLYDPATGRCLPTLAERAAEEHEAWRREAEARQREAEVRQQVETENERLRRELEALRRDRTGGA